MCDFESSSFFGLNHEWVAFLDNPIFSDMSPASSTAVPTDVPDLFIGAIAIQATFGPTFTFADKLPDFVLTTADDTQFHIHRHILQQASINFFDGILEVHPTTGILTELSAEISVVLHVIYGLDCLHLTPTLDTVEAAIEGLIKYGVPINALAVPNLPLYQLVHFHALYHPIDAYAVAAHYGFEALAVNISAHLLAYDLSDLTDELSVKMGPLYLRRLFRLHLTRRDALKNIVLKLPDMHPSDIDGCTEESQMQIARSWAFCAAELAWENVPTKSVYGLQSAFEKAGTNITCEECLSRLRRRIEEVMEEWAAVQRTI